MKTQKKEKGIIAKTIILNLIISSTIIMGTSVYAQRASDAQQYAFNNQNAGKYMLTSFTVKYVEGKAYVNWLTFEPATESIYVLERSDDGKNFKSINTKPGCKSPGHIELLNSFVDANPIPGTSFYRLIRYTANEKSTSDVISVNTGEITALKYENALSRR